MSAEPHHMFTGSYWIIRDGTKLRVREYDGLDFINERPFNASINGVLGRYTPTMLLLATHHDCIVINLVTLTETVLIRQRALVGNPRHRNPYVHLQTAHLCHDRVYMRIRDADCLFVCNIQTMTWNEIVLGEYEMRTCNFQQDEMMLVTRALHERILFRYALNNNDGLDVIRLYHIPFVLQNEPKLWWKGDDIVMCVNNQWFWYNGKDWAGIPDFPTTTFLNGVYPLFSFGKLYEFAKGQFTPYALVLEVPDARWVLERTPAGPVLFDYQHGLVLTYIPTADFEAGKAATEAQWGKRSRPSMADILGNPTTGVQVLQQWLLSP